MSKILNWIKTNKLLTAFIIIVGYLLFRSAYGVNLLGLDMPSSSQGRLAPLSELGTGGVSAPAVGIVPPSPRFPEPVSDAEDRLVIHESNLSLLVDDVRGVGERIIAFAKEQGGFMVSSSYSRPEDSPFATITIRVPADKFDQTLSFLRAQAVKVTNENLVGEDVTAQYTDIGARIETLETTKQKFEALLDQTNNIDQLLRIQREIISLQTQIDSLIGQREALEKNAKFTKITVFLSTDELALPYTPEKTFRPAVVFKLAIRSMLNTLRVIASAAIWVGVYAVIWLPLLGAVVFIKRWKSKKQIQS